MAKEYKILKNFRGSQEGNVVEQFTAGEVVKLSDSLAAVVVPEGWAKEIKKLETAVKQPKETTAKPSRKRKTK